MLSNVMRTLRQTGFSLWRHSQKLVVSNCSAGDAVKKSASLIGSAPPDVKPSILHSYGGINNLAFLCLPVRSSPNIRSRRHLTTSSRALCSSEDDNSDDDLERLSNRPIGFCYTNAYAHFCRDNKLPYKEASYKWNSLSADDRKLYEWQARVTEGQRKQWYKELSQPVKQVLRKSRKVKRPSGTDWEAQLLQISDELQEALKHGPESDRITWKKILEHRVLTKSGHKLWVEREVILKAEKEKKIDEEHPSDQEVTSNEFDEDDTEQDEPGHDSASNEKHDNDDELK